MNLKLNIEKVAEKTDYNSIVWNTDMTVAPQWKDCYCKTIDFCGIIYINESHQCRWSNNYHLIHTKPLGWQYINEELEKECTNL